MNDVKLEHGEIRVVIEETGEPVLETKDIEEIRKLAHHDATFWIDHIFYYHTGYGDRVYLKPESLLSGLLDGSIYQFFNLALKD